MSELTIAALRLGLFVLMWIFVFAVAAVLRRDLFGARAQTGRRATRPAKPMPQPSYEAGPIPRPEEIAATPRHLRVVQGSLAGTTVPLSGTPITIGRSHSSTLVLSDDFASGRHARIVPGEGGWWIEDAGSTNGTLVDGERITAPVRLRVGTRITIGHTVMELAP
ncbi:FHA domain-containing protein FhaB/FipA [Sediminivirga luteola]|uniref:FHA domain-containing protein n=1 Tax=Sediminivirga luteola TaxID=1774748 RepID=A0A8J2TZJ1_9MICO|nr:FHA domain-containing protein [Sediminivirga luteola]GGA19753.1 FHA domain-containing protein [Sediminivirga luteola]